MSTRFVWTELKKLVGIDHEIGNLKTSFHQKESLFAKEQAGMKAITSEHATLSAKLREITKKADAIELELNSVRAEESRKKDQLEKSSNPREYSALEREIALIESSVDELETRLTVQWEDRDAIQTSLERTAEQLKEEEERVNSASNAFDIEKDKFDLTLSSLSAEWNKQAKLVPADLLETYNEIRQRVPNPVVSIVSDSCSACFTALLHQDKLAVTSSAVVRCKGCYRFLCLDEEIPEQAVAPETPAEVPAE
jgi:predicted  nucleic acid-binding Zn-ribbon protein